MVAMMIAIKEYNADRDPSVLSIVAITHALIYFYHRPNSLTWRLRPHIDPTAPMWTDLGPSQPTRNADRRDRKEATALINVGTMWPVARGLACGLHPRCSCSVSNQVNVGVSLVGRGAERSSL